MAEENLKDRLEGVMEGVPGTEVQAGFGRYYELSRQLGGAHQQMVDDIAQRLMAVRGIASGGYQERTTELSKALTEFRGRYSDFGISIPVGVATSKGFDNSIGWIGRQVEGAKAYAADTTGIALGVGGAVASIAKNNNPFVADITVAEAYEVAYKAVQQRIELGDQAGNKTVETTLGWFESIQQIIENVWDYARAGFLSVTTSQSFSDVYEGIASERQEQRTAANKEKYEAQGQLLAMEYRQGKMYDHVMGMTLDGGAKVGADVAAIVTGLHPEADKLTARPMTENVGDDVAKLIEQQRKQHVPSLGEKSASFYQKHGNLGVYVAAELSVLGANAATAVFGKTLIGRMATHSLVGRAVGGVASAVGGSVVSSSSAASKGSAFRSVRATSVATKLEGIPKAALGARAMGAASAVLSRASWVGWAYTVGQVASHAAEQSYVLEGSVAPVHHQAMDEMLSAFVASAPDELLENIDDDVLRAALIGARERNDALERLDKISRDSSVDEIVAVFPELKNIDPSYDAAMEIVGRKQRAARIQAEEVMMNQGVMYIFHQTNGQVVGAELAGAVLLQLQRDLLSWDAVYQEYLKEQEIESAPKDVKPLQSDEISALSIPPEVLRGAVEQARVAAVVGTQVLETPTLIQTDGPMHVSGAELITGGADAKNITQTAAVASLAGGAAVQVG